MNNLNAGSKSNEILDLSYLETQYDKKEEVEQVETVDEQVSETVETTSEETKVQEEVSTEPSEQLEQNKSDNHQFELTDELLLNTLSEKLGKELSSFDELNREPESINPQLKQINDWMTKTNRPVEDFFKFQKNYNEFSDEEVVREYLHEKYPSLDSSEISYKMRSYLPNEEDLEEESISKKIELKTLAVEARNHLNSLRMELEKPVSPEIPQEYKDKVKVYDDIQQQLSNQRKQQEDYLQGLVNTSSKIDRLNLNLSDDVKIDYTFDEKSRKNISNFINEMPHWKNEDGSWNFKAVIEDAYKIKHFDSIIQECFKQGKNSGISDTVKTQKNITLDNEPVNAQESGKKGVRIEGLEDILQSPNMRLRNYR